MSQAKKESQAVPEGSGRVVSMHDLVDQHAPRPEEAKSADSKSQDIWEQVLFSAYYILSRMIRIVNWAVVRFILLTGGSVQVACISNCRDEVDVSKFGFSSIRNFPSVMPWILFRWNKAWGQLYMIGSVTDEIAGDLSTPESIERGRQQFISAVRCAVKNGATTILYAAATKRLFIKGELELQFPNLVFTLGDNFTGLLLGEIILDAFKRSNLNVKNSKVLLIAPYGLLGSVSLHYLLQSGCEVILMGSIKRKDLLETIAKKHGLRCIFSFEAAGAVDMVIACNSAPGVKLNQARVELIRRQNKKLIVIDPNEPQNMTPESFEACAGKVLRYDAGNGMDRNLHYILGGLAAWVLRLRSKVIWGCFCEALIISENLSKLEGIDWYEISPQNISVVKEYFGKNRGQIGLPEPLNFNRPIQSFSIDI